MSSIKLYKLSSKAVILLPSLTSLPSPVMRYQALHDILQETAGQPFTANEARLALHVADTKLGSGSPSSFVRAFVDEGYFEVLS